MGGQGTEQLRGQGEGGHREAGGGRGRGEAGHTASAGAEGREQQAGVGSGAPGSVGAEQQQGPLQRLLEVVPSLLASLTDILTAGMTCTHFTFLPPLLLM